MTYPEPQAARPSRVRFGVLNFISSLSILTYLDRTCISRVQKDIKLDLSLDDAQMGLVFGAFYVGYGLFEVPAGWMGDTWGTRRVLTRIVLWWSLFTTLTGAIGWLKGYRDYHWLLAGWEVSVLFLLMLAVRFLFDCGEAGAYPNLAKVVSTWFPFRERGLAQGAIWFFARLGGAMAPFLIGRLTTLVGWQQAFCVFGVAGVLWCFAFYAWFRDTPEEIPACNQAERELIQEYLVEKTPALDEGIEKEEEKEKEKERESHARGFPPLGPLLASGTMWALCLAAVFVNLAWHFFPTWQPRYFEDVFDISMEGSELLVGLPYLCGALGAFAGGTISDRLIRRTGSRRWGRSLVGLVGFGGAGVCAFCLVLVTEAWQAVCLLCLIFLINDLAVPVIWAASTDVSGRFTGTITAIVNTAGCIGGFLCPVLMGAFLDKATEQHPPRELWPVIFTGLATKRAIIQHQSCPRFMATVMPISFGICPAPWTQIERSLAVESPVVTASSRWKPPGRRLLVKRGPVGVAVSAWTASSPGGLRPPPGHPARPFRGRPLGCAPVRRRRGRPPQGPVPRPAWPPAANQKMKKLGISRRE